MKLGAVVIPATTLLTPATTCATASSAARVRHVVASAGQRAKFARRGRRLHPDRRRRRVARLASPTSGETGAPADFTPRRRDARRTIRCCSTSRPARPPSPSSCCTRTELSGGPPVDDVLDRPAAGRRALEHQLARAGRSTPGAASSRRGTRGRRCSSTTTRASTRGRCWTCSCAAASRRLRAADRLAHADPGGSRRRDRWRCAKLVGAGEPLNPEVIEQVQHAWGLTIRDGYGQTETTAQVGNSPGPAGEARLDGTAAARLRRRAARRRRQRAATEGEICLALDAAPLGLMAGYHGRSAE